MKEEISKKTETMQKVKEEKYHPLEFASHNDSFYDPQHFPIDSKRAVIY